MKPGLICLVRRHLWHSSWDSDEQKAVWTCTRCGRTRVRIGEMDPRRSGWGFWWLTSHKGGPIRGGGTSSGCPVGPRDGVVS
jgi:hypothetical protein